MKLSKREKLKNMKLKTLRKYLGTLADVPVSERLEEKILSKVLPIASSELKAQTLSYKWKFNIGAVAAIIILFIALMLFVNLSVPSANADKASLPFDTTLCYPNRLLHYYLDERNGLTEDINYVNVVDF